MTPLKPVDIIAIIFSLGYFLIVINLFFFNVPAENKDMLNMLFGMLSTVMISIVHMYFNGKESA